MLEKLNIYKQDRNLGWPANLAIHQNQVGIHALHWFNYKWWFSRCSFHVVARWIVAFWCSFQHQSTNSAYFDMTRLKGHFSLKWPFDVTHWCLLFCLTHVFCLPLSSWTLLIKWECTIQSRNRIEEGKIATLHHL